MQTKTLTQTIPRPQIRLHGPLAMAAPFVKDITHTATDYRQTTRMIGGYWNASWSMAGLSDTAKTDFFNKRIGSHIVCKHGGMVIWEGLIWSMDLRINGVVRRITMADARNRVKTAYTDPEGDPQRTMWYDKNASINRFGRIEEILTLNKVATSTAQAYAQTVAAEIQTPLPNALSFAEPQKDDVSTLQVEAVGYAYTLNYQYLNISDISRDIPAAITAALAGMSNPFVTQGSLQANTIEVVPPDNDTKVLDWLLEITEIGDGTNPYVLQVWNNRRLSYKRLYPQPTISWNGKQIRTIAGRAASSQHYALKPGILRDYTWRNAPLNSDYFLENQRDSIVTEVEAGETYTQPLMKTNQYEDSDFLAALAANNVRIAQWYEDKNKT